MIRGVNISILDVRKTDFNVIIQCMIYDVDAGLLAGNLIATLLHKGNIEWHDFDNIYRVQNSNLCEENHITSLGENRIQ